MVLLRGWSLNPNVLPPKMLPKRFLWRTSMAGPKMVLHCKRNTLVNSLCVCILRAQRFCSAGVFNLFLSTDYYFF